MERITRKLSKPIKKLSRNNLSQIDLLDCTFQIKAAFSDFLLNLINNYLPFFLFSRDFNDKNVLSSEIFDQTGYSRIFPQEDLAFIQEFALKTMMFSRFLEDSYKILYFLDFVKKDLLELDEGLNETKGFIMGLKKLIKTLNKNGKFEGFLDLEALPHLERLIVLEGDLRKQLALESLLNPKTIRLSQFFIRYFQEIGSNKESLNIKKPFLLLKGFKANRFYSFKSHNPNCFPLNEKPLTSDEFAEFDTINPINFPSTPMQFPAKSPELCPTDLTNKGFIEGILLKEMQLALQEERKPRRKTIFSNEKAQNMVIPPLIEDLDEMFKRPILSLKKTQSEQIGSLNIGSKTPCIRKENIGKSSFEQFSNKNRVGQRGGLEEDETRKVPVLTVKNNEKGEENQNFSIFSYLISDLMDSKENFAFLPSNKKGNIIGLNQLKDPLGLTPLQLKRNLTAGGTIDYNKNKEEKQIKEIPSIMNNKGKEENPFILQKEFTYNKEKIGFKGGFKGKINKEEEPLKEMTNLENSKFFHDYNTRLIKKK